MCSCMKPNFFELNETSFCLQSGDEVIAIDRTTLQAVEPIFGSCPTSFLYSLGLFEVDNTLFMINITDACSINGISKIQIAKKFDCIQITPGRINEKAQELLLESFRFCPIFFGDGIWGLQGKRDEFVWNGVAIFKMRALFPNAKLECLIEVITGSVVEWDGNMLISRRSRYRASSHFWIRGADSNGRVANLIETEQIINKDGHSYSYLQIRGSMPFNWSESPTLAILPPVSVNQAEASELFDKHLYQIKELYGEIFPLNLTTAKGRESQVCNLMNSMPGVVHFDYQTINPVWKDSVFDILFQRVNPLIFGFFEKVGDHVKQKQSGVIRTNCMDCLDRTNVVQALFALSVAESIGFSDIKSLRRAWYINGNALATSITGAGALKTDVTLNGHASIVGFVSDVKCVLHRYVNDMYFSGYRQDALDCVTQEIPVVFQKAHNDNRIIGAILSIIMAIVFLFSSEGGFPKAQSAFHDAQRCLISHPHYRKYDDASE